MKIIVAFLLAFFTLINVNAQKKTFIRVYNMEGKKIAKGFFGGTTDSTLLLIKDGVSTAIAVSQIRNIRTKRTAGHSMLAVGTVFTVGMAAILSLGVSISDSNTDLTGQAVAASLFVGTISGILIGGLGSVLKGSENFEVNGNTENWLKVKDILNKKPVYKKSNQK